jgi:hypothetical protein
MREAMPDNISNNIFPFALGCLDREEFIELISQLEKGEEIPAKELGELQNIASLLPAILNIEQPAYSVKDKVARKLYRIKDELKSRREKTGLSTSETSKEEPAEESNQTISIADSEHDIFNDIEEKTFKNEPEKFVITSDPEETSEKPFSLGGFEPVKPKRKTGEFYKTEEVEQKEFEQEEFESEEAEQFESKHQEIEHEEILESETHQEETPSSSRKPEVTSDDVDEEELIDSIIEQEGGSTLRKDYRKNYLNKKTLLTYVALMLALIVLVAVIVAYLDFASDVRSYKSQVEDLTARVTNLTFRVESSREIEKILEADNAAVITLTGTRLNPQGTGKVILDLSDNRGYLQLMRMPRLPENRTYQLWIEAGTAPFTVANVRPVDEVEYYPFDLPLITPGQRINFLVTEEPNDGSTVPGRRVFLEGNLSSF